MNNNYEIYLMKLKTSKERILKVNKSISTNAGIYLFYRIDENGQYHGYIGQSTNVLRRCAEHLLGYQKIDISIKEHGLYDPNKNPFGYLVKILSYCVSSKLDELEKKYIRIYLEKGFILKNITSGGQDAGRTNINEAKPAKKYNDGLKHGYTNCLKEVKEFFDKYLDFKIKEPALTKKGKPIVIKQKKFEQFSEFLKGGNE